jgi:crossover junction endodeoxyribonuclease RusA
MKIILPWPDSALLPNRRNGRGWQVTQAAKVVAKFDAAHATRLALNFSPERIEPTMPAEVTIFFYPPDKRARDIDGMLSSLKPSLDAIAEVLGINDKMFAPFHLYPCEAIKGGQVTIIIEQVPF